MAGSLTCSFVDWQTTKGTVRERTAFLFNNSLMSDFMFVLAGSDGTQVRVPAHKFVLAMGSPVFEAMFYGEWAEKRREIELPDTDAEFLVGFLRFMYCDEVDLNADNVLGVLYLAQKYFVPILATKCIRYLDDYMTSGTVCQILEVARRFGDSALEQRCWQLIDDRTSAVLASEGVLMLSRDSLVDLLKRETLWAEELEIFHAADRWAEAQCAQKTGPSEPSGAKKREILDDAVNFIRFPTMSCDTFALHVVPTKILTSEESQEVQYYLNNLIPAAEMQFPCTMRGCFKTELWSCARYSGDIIGVACGEKTVTESVTFEADMHVKLGGVCLYGIGHCAAEVRVTDHLGEKLATALRVNKHGYAPDATRQFDVMFDRPVRVSASSAYVINARLRRIDGENARENTSQSLDTTKCAGVTFTLRGSSCAGLILELLFSLRKN